MTPDYFLDVFSVMSGDEHAYDWVLRAFDDEGRTRRDMADESFGFATTEGPYGMMRNVRALRTDDAWRCHWKQDGVRFWLSMLGEPGTRVIFAEGPKDDQYSAPSIPMVLVRRVARQTHFVSLMAPMRAKSTGPTMERICSSKGVLSLRIGVSGYEDYIGLNLASRPRAVKLVVPRRRGSVCGNGIYIYRRFIRRQTETKGTQ
jgi:hypothetical protein